MKPQTIRRLVLAETTLFGIAALVTLLMRYMGLCTHELFLELMVMFTLFILLDFYSVFALAHFKS